MTNGVMLNRGAETLPPHSQDAEESVLGSLLIDPTDGYVAVADILTAADFYLPRHRDIFAAMERLAARQEPTDFVMVSDELERSGDFESIGGVTYLAQLLTSVPTSVHVVHYAGIVARTAMLRRLISAGSRIASLGYQDADDLDDLLSQADQTLAAVTGRVRAKSWTELGAAAPRYLESVEPSIEGRVQSGVMPTGFYDLDRLLGGLYAGDLVILAARPGLGKTSLALGMAHEVGVCLKANVGLFSLEMSGLQVAGRFIAMMADVDVARLREGRINAQEYERIGGALKKMESATLWIDDSSALSLRELETRARRLHAEHPLQLLIVDYLQLVSGPGENRVQQVATISRTLKALAGDLGCPVLALSQLSRAVEQRPDHRPMLSDLRDSGSIEQDADVVLFIYREDAYDRDCETKGVAEIHVAKHRNGPVGACQLLFLERTARFVDLGMRNG